MVAAIYVESWNQGFGHLLGTREVTPDLVARWQHDLVQGAAEWTVAEVDGSVVGLVGVGPSRDPLDPQLGELDTIAVVPARWRAGIGRRLMHHALDVMRTSWDRAIVWTPANYERGHGFYRATGWIPLDRHRRDHTEVAFGHSLVDPTNGSRHTA